MLKFCIVLVFSCSCVFMLPAMIQADMQSTHYTIWADDFGAGGSEGSTSANYGIQDTIGEAIILSATSTSDSYGTKAGFREMYPDQYLTFSVGAASVALGTLSTTATKSASHTMTVDTNAAGGFQITMSGSTLTNGAQTIAAIGAVAAASSIGSNQFGINLAANTTPAVGAAPSGTAPIGTAASPYNTADQFAFQGGDTVASASSLANSTVYTVSYIANISSSATAGDYTTTLTYSATANF